MSPEQPRRGQEVPTREGSVPGSAGLLTDAEELERQGCVKDGGLRVSP